MNGVDASFLASFRHRHLARAVVRRGLLVKVSTDILSSLYPVTVLLYVQVPACDFAGYVGAMVKELYGPLEAAVQGTLTGPGTLGTVLLCESLLSFLPSGCVLEQPIRLFQAYDILPLSKLKRTHKVDLRQFATIRNGVLYIRRPAFQKILIPKWSLPNAARATAYSMISFLEKLRAGRNTVEAITRAAGIIVEQFKRDLRDMCVVRDFQLFNGVVLHGCIRDAQTADEYVSRVFVPDYLPSCMATKGFLSVALDLFNPSELNRKIIESLLHVAVVPHAIVHARAVCFSSTFCTVIIRGPVSAATVSPSDAHRLVIAATQLLRDNFSLSRKEMKAVQKCRPRLTGCVVEAICKARLRTGSLRHILRVVAYATMYLADKEELMSRKPDYHNLYRSCNLSRFILKREMNGIVMAILAIEERSLEEGACGWKEKADSTKCHTEVQRCC